MTLSFMFVFYGFDYVCFRNVMCNLQVGLIIGKGGETIKNMQASTGARIQVFTSK